MGLTLVQKQMSLYRKLTRVPLSIRSGQEKAAEAAAATGTVQEGNPAHRGSLFRGRGLGNSKPLGL